MKPIIGVIPLVDKKRESYWMLPGYMTGISAAGGIPVMLPLEMDQDDIYQTAEALDGFMFTGGHDVSPELYGEEKDPLCQEVCEERDSLESVLFTAVRKLDKPILGICRGIQLINVLMGGTLYQDIPSQTVSTVEHHGKPPYDQPVHEITVVPGTPLFDLCGAKLDVNSYHHQAVKKLGNGLTIMAYADDGIAEAVFDKNARFLWAVQFHPEFSWRKDPNCRKIFEAFVRACEGDIRS